MRRSFSVLVENKAGVLSRISGLFSRRGYNINSLSVGETDDESISRMTISATGDERILEQIEKQLNKQIDVIKVQTMDMHLSTRREFILLKVSCQPNTRGEIMDVCTILRAKIVDISHTTITIEASDIPENIDLLIDMMTPYGIIEMARTGMVALQKGSEAITIKK